MLQFGIIKSEFLTEIDEEPGLIFDNNSNESIDRPFPQEVTKKVSNETLMQALQTPLEAKVIDSSEMEVNEAKIASEESAIEAKFASEESAIEAQAVSTATIAHEEIAKHIPQKENIAKELSSVLDEDFEHAQEAGLAAGESIMLTEGELPFARLETDKIVPEIISLSNNQTVILTNEILYIGTDPNHELHLESKYWDNIQIAVIRNDSTREYFLKKLGENECRLNGIPIQNIVALKNGDCFSSAEHRFYYFDGTAMLSVRNELKSGFKIKHNISLDNEEENIYELFDKYLNLKTHFFSSDKSNMIFWINNYRDRIYVLYGEIEGKENTDTFRSWLRGVFDSHFIDKSPLQILDILNSAICLKYPSITIHATTLIISRGKIEFASDSSNSLLLQKEDSEVQSIECIGLPLGISKVYHAKDGIIDIKPGEKFLCFSKSLLINHICENGKILVSVDNILKLFSELTRENKDIFENMKEKLEKSLNVDASFLMACFEVQKGQNKLVCPTCGNVYEESFKFCPEDGTKLM